MEESSEEAEVEAEVEAEGKGREGGVSRIICNIGLKGVANLN
jgi:hypothetical protein